MPGGRPRLFSDAEEFEAKTQEYFDSVKMEGGFPNLAALCLHLGFSDKESFSKYADYGEEFSRTVKNAKLRIEAHRHSLLISKEKFTPGVIFDLKNNHGWSDKTEVEHSGAIGSATDEQIDERLKALMARDAVKG